jgi:hypothetical protein
MIAPPCEKELAGPGVLLSEVTPEPVQWLWEGRIPRAKLTVMDGDPGTGKSALTMYLAARVSMGEVLPGGSITEPAGVVLLSAEDGLEDTVRPRLDAAGANTSKILALATKDDGEGGELLLSLPEDVSLIEEGIGRVKAALVIVDPLLAFLGSKIDSYRDQDVRRALAPLAAMAQRTGAAVVVVRHLTKANDGKPIYRGGGSIGIIGAARSGLIVAEDPQDGDRRILASQKSNLARSAPSLAFSLEDAENGAVRVVWRGESPLGAAELLAARTNGDDNTQLAKAIRFLEELLAHGAVPSKRVEAEAKAAGIAKRTLERAKESLGVVSKKRDGIWFWTLPEDRQVPVPDNLGDVGGLGDVGPDAVRTGEEETANHEQKSSTMLASSEEDRQGRQGRQGGKGDDLGDVALMTAPDDPGFVQVRNLLTDPSTGAHSVYRGYRQGRMSIAHLVTEVSYELTGSYDGLSRYTDIVERVVADLKRNEGAT